LNEIREKKDLLPEAVKGDWMKGFHPLIMRKARGLTNNPLPTSCLNPNHADIKLVRVYYFREFPHILLLVSPARF
jgi:hypothetical protein